jgi:hypothetical protein
VIIHLDINNKKIENNMNKYVYYSILSKMSYLSIENIKLCHIAQLVVPIKEIIERISSDPKIFSACEYILDNPDDHFIDTDIIKYIRDNRKNIMNNFQLYISVHLISVFCCANNCCPHPDCYTFTECIKCNNCCELYYEINTRNKKYIRDNGEMRSIENFSYKSTVYNFFEKNIFLNIEWYIYLDKPFLKKSVKRLETLINKDMINKVQGYFSAYDSSILIYDMMNNNDTILIKEIRNIILFLYLNLIVITFL